MECADVFIDDLGKITPVKAKIAMSPVAVPRFHRLRVSYALRPLMEQKLHRLAKAGVLVQDDYSEGAVTVPTRDGNDN